MKSLITCVVVLLMVCVQSVAGEMKTITAAADPYPPFVDPKHPREGLALEIIRAAYKTQGYEVKMEFMPWARAEGEVKKGKIDILPDVWMTDARKKELAFGKAYTANRVKFIVLKSDPFEYEGMKSLSGKTIGTIRNYGYNDEFNRAKEFKREEVPDFIQNIRKLTMKRIDMAIEDEIVAKARMKAEDPKLLEQVRFTKNPFSTNELYMASGLSNPRHKELVDAFNKGLDVIKGNGTYAKIMESYGIK